MKTTYLDFEQPVAELEEKIEQLRFMQGESAVDIAEEIDRLRGKCDSQIKDIYDKLTPWQVAMVARHPQRPYTLDYINLLMTDFHELHGDRTFADDPAIVGGLARFNGQSIMLIGHQKGRDAKERTYRNFGMPRPEGYRKALRLMKLAEKFDVPVLTLIDTPGAFPGIGAEERGQSEAIGRNLYVMAELQVPIISVIIGEGGSGGALALGVSRHHADAPVRRLLGDLARRLRCDSLEERREGTRGGRDARHHCDPAQGSRTGRSDRQRADRRRASRSRPDGGQRSSGRSPTPCASSPACAPAN